MKKSPEEIEFDKLNEKYEERFGEYYVREFNDPRPRSYHMEAIRKCLKSGKPAEIMKLPKGAV